MEFFEGTLGETVVVGLIAIFFATFFLWIGAKIAGVKKSNFGRSFVAAIGSGFITWLFSLIFTQIEGVVTIIGFIIGLLLTIFVIKAAYGTSFGRALLVWIFHIIAEVIALVFGMLIFANLLIT